MSPLLSFFAAQMGSNRAIEKKQAAFEVTTRNLAEQFSSMRSDFNSLSTRIDSRLGDIGYMKRQQEITDTFLRDQNAYNFNVNKALTEIVTTMRLRGLPVPKVPEPPKLGGQ